MKSYLAILRNILIVCFLFGFVNADNNLNEASDDFDEVYDDFDKVEDVSLEDVHLEDIQQLNDKLSFGSLSDISLDDINKIEQAGPQGPSLKDKIEFFCGFCKDVTQQHVLRNKRKYICGATTAAIILLIYYFGHGGSSGGVAMPIPN
jgi:hypothetical protein